MDGQQPECLAPVRARLQDLVDRAKTPGIQYIAVDATRVICACAAGLADIRAQKPMDVATTMMAYSMSKTITAVAVLQLVERGLIALDAPVTRYLPESPYGDRVTVADLMAHTGGLPNPIPLRWVHPFAEHGAFDEHQAFSAVLLANPRLSREPGARYAYSNIGYWMLGAIVERVAAMAFTSYVTTRVLEPLGLGAGELGYTVSDPGRHATG